jgi:replicative DNA helicase
MLENEQTLIGLLLLKPDLINKVTDLQPHQFSEPLHCEAFKTIVQGYYKGVNCSPLSLQAKFKDELSGNENYFSKLCASVNMIHDVTDLAESIRNEYIATEAHRILTEALNTKKNSDVLDDTLNALYELKNGVQSHKVKSNAKVMQEVYEDLTIDLPIISTGLNSLDTAMGGGLIQGRAYGIAAPKKTGKTAMLATIASNVFNNGGKVLYVALEMGAQQIMHRIAARQLGLNPLAFIGDQRKEDWFKNKVAEYVARTPEGLYFLDMAGSTVATLEGALTPAVRRNDIDLVIIDYWQLVGGKKNGQSQAEHQDFVAQWIAEFSKREKIATLTASQINQDGNTRGGEGMRLAFDQVYQMHKCESYQDCIWLQMMDTRYTMWSDLGDNNNPAFKLNHKGVFFEEI